jgi:tetratricopeptide (TPR) repeat protein
MVAFMVWISLKIIESIQKIFIGFKKTWDTRFDNNMEKLMDIGEYNKVIEECKDVLDKYPNHVDAVWYTAKAHYYKENNEESKQYFNKAIY